MNLLCAVRTVPGTIPVSTRNSQCQKSGSLIPVQYTSLYYRRVLDWSSTTVERVPRRRVGTFPRAPEAAVQIVK